MKVLVKFEKGFSGFDQAKVMFEMELALQKLGYDAHVEKETMGDDSRLRVMMTKEQRDKL